MGKNSKVQKMVIIAVLSSIAYLLMMLNFPLPGLPPFLKIDFSEVPALIAAVIFGPLAGIGVEAIKNIIYVGLQGNYTVVPVGEIANFVAGCLYILPASYLFRKYHTIKGLTIGLVIGTILMTGIMSVLNYYVIFPAYTYFLNMPAMSSEAVKDVVVVGIMPFNAIKGIIIAIVLVLLFQRLKPWLQMKMKNA
ncbi:ECF transporter S component [Priestia taiwanensis]|uniref:Riboflavin transporter n=1 Tax=Priestia taiwanensis TaxID=1347902 RepID=A0A917AJM2_9BACI|nr:ECF transporter S component [Priestia taiwanensis]MBM7361619.1 riboflavin transporter FmnP [Priestia taiwanensis]GGE55564.1 riboflavin transporter [Priestia taiwanensis]